MAETTATVTSSWRAKMSVRSRSNLSAHMCALVTASINWPVMRTFPDALRTEPLEEVAHAEPASNLLHIDGFAFERKARIASDHEQPLEPRARGGDLLNHACREIL